MGDKFSLCKQQFKKESVIKFFKSNYAKIIDYLLIILLVYTSRHLQESNALTTLIGANVISF